ncbi:arsenate reductase (glutaredoxin) [Burkholderia glumae]
MITIYHNPRCSKSRETLALLDTLNTSGEPVEVVEYLKAALTVAELKALHRQLDRPLLEMVRDNEAPFQELGLDRADLDDEALYQAIADHPVLLQRPIVVRGGKAVIGRPPEAVRVLFAPTMQRLFF